MADSPTARSLKRIRMDGWTAAVTERWNPYAGIRQDLFGFIDVLAIREGAVGCLAIQATTGDNATKRMAKAAGVEHLKTWLAAGNRFEVWAWRKMKVKRGGKAVRWSCRIIVAGIKEGVVVYDEL